MVVVLNLLRVSSCEIFTCCDVLMKQNKKRQKTLESAQYRLEIVFKQNKIP